MKLPSPEEITKGNILIARYSTDEPKVLERDLKKAGTNLHYHDEWDWIMPVVVLLHRKGYQVTIDIGGCVIFREKQHDITSCMATKNPDLLITDIWICIVALIRKLTERNLADRN